MGENSSIGWGLFTQKQRQAGCCQSEILRGDLGSRPFSTFAPQMRQPRLSIGRIFCVRDRPRGCGLILRGFLSDGCG